MTTTCCSVKLLNKIYDVKCPKGKEANLQLAASKLNSELLGNRKKFKQLDDFQNLVLAALHISYELVSSQQHNEDQRQQVAELISSLENKLNQVVKREASLEVESA